MRCFSFSRLLCGSWISSIEGNGHIMITISIMGTGWLGLPLAQHFIKAGYVVKASTTSKNRRADLMSIGADPFIIDIDSLTSTAQDFLQANILIINIPSKNVSSFRQLLNEIEASEIENVLFVSSTSVYENINKTIFETDTNSFSQSPLLEIEGLLTSCNTIRLTIVRFGGLIGYSRHPGRFFHSGRVVQNPEAPVNMIHRDDCIGIISQIVEQQVWGEVLNCCADTHPTRREFYTRAVESINGILPEFAESGSSFGKQISNQKVKRFLKYQFKHPDLMNFDFQESS